MPRIDAMGRDSGFSWVVCFMVWWSELITKRRSAHTEKLPAYKALDKHQNSHAQAQALVDLIVVVCQNRII